MGIKVLKFFPVEVLNGIEMLKALNGPFGFYGIKFIPTGGIDERNFLDYLKLDNVLGVGDSFGIDKTALNKKDWQTMKKKILSLKEKIKTLNEK